MKIVENPTQIRISKNSGTIILLAGVQGSGKSFFANKYFDHSCIINCDNIFYNELEKSCFKDVISNERFKYIHNIASQKVIGMVQSYRQTRPYTVLDSVGFNYRDWLKLIQELKTLYNNIILIVVHPHLLTIKSQLMEREKRSFDKISIGMRAPDLQEIFLFWQLLEMDIRSKEIGTKADTTYIIRNLKNTTVII